MRFHRNFSEFSAPPSTPVNSNSPLKPSSEQKILQTAFDEMILLQHADGSWDISDRFCTIIKKSQEAVQAANPSMKIKKLSIAEQLIEADMASLWATALALAWLEIAHSDKREVWELLHEKGVAYVEQNKAKAPEISDWISIARKFLSS